jgi:hypothetical protein
MKSRRLLVVAVTLSLACTACGGGGGASGSSAAKARGPISIWYSNNAQEGAWGKQLVTAWNAGHPTEKVTAQEIRQTVAYVFVPHSDYSRYEIRVLDIAESTVRDLTGTPGIRDYALDWSPDGSTIAVASELSGWFELHLVAADGSGTRQLTSAHADFLEARHPDGTRLVATPGERAFDLVTVALADGSVTEPRRRWRLGIPGWTADGRILASHESPTTAPSSGSSPRMERSRRSMHPPAGRRAALRGGGGVDVPTFRRTRDPAFLYRPCRRLHGAAGAGDRHRGGPADCYGGEWDGHAQYFVDKGYAWLRSISRLTRARQRLRAREPRRLGESTDTKDCLAAADYLRTVDWVDGERSGSSGELRVVHGSSRSHRRPRAPVPVCDLQVRRLRRLDHLGPGDRARCADADADHGAPARSPGRLPRGIARAPARRRAVPILVAHGHTDRRVPFEQSTELVRSSHDSARPTNT